MNEKTPQIKNFKAKILKKYKLQEILITDYWDSDTTAIGFSDKKKKYIVYITDNGGSDNLFFISLEESSISDELLYKTVGEFKNVTEQDVEKILVKHLRILE